MIQLINLYPKNNTNFNLKINKFKIHILRKMKQEVLEFPRYLKIKTRQNFLILPLTLKIKIIFNNMTAK